jgi:hypothetical protein
MSLFLRALTTVLLTGAAAMATGSTGTSVDRAGSSTPAASVLADGTAPACAACWVPTNP